MIPDLDALITFVEVVERGGFTAAARRLGVSKSMASRRVMRLESTLRARLLHRTTRGLSPTQAGHAFHARCRALLNELDEACEQVTGSDGDVSGLLRLTAPASFGEALVTPVLAALMHSHPRLELEVVLDERRLALVEEGFDLAIRAGSLSDSTLVERRLALVGGMVVASRAYLDAHGTPTEPSQLAGHICLDHSELAPQALWRFRGETGETAPRTSRRLRINSFGAMRQLAASGAGIAVLPDFDAAGPVARGELVRLMPDHPLVEHALWAVYPRAGRVSPKLRVVLDALVSYARRPVATWGTPM